MKKLFCLLIPILGLLSCSNELQETLHMAIAMSNESISFPTTEKTKIETDMLLSSTDIDKRQLHQQVHSDGWEPIT